MISKEDADNLENESPKELVDIICSQSELIDSMEAQLKEKDKRIVELEEAMKPKTCEGCKYIKGIKPKLGQTYCAIGIEDLNYDLGVKKDFCCNRYEPKATT